ncbi:HK97 family phage prohead protease [Rhodococcus sp. ACS1]|uniref:HK97 family phage prohead protease n=1 Tax=Rhodococcus sp. ACS1 TaxID=2028570 RepID=UPI00211C4EB8|nr:HK97 family phage prohead protease [Rhodococcus sp. ACS1]
MSETLFRNTELRADGTGRTIYGVAVPYGVETEIHEHGSTYREAFAPSAFQRSLTERSGKIRLLISHDRGKLPVGRAVELFEQSDGLHCAFAIANTRDGNDCLELVRSGCVDQFSVGFVPIRSRQADGVTVRTECSLREVSLVSHAAYPAATVAGVRHALEQAQRMSVDTASRRLEILVRSAWPDIAARASDKLPHGDVEYADPDGYQSDGKARYPIDTKEHVKAAWSYINQKANAAKYTPEQLAKIKARIVAAAKKFDINISESS